MSVAAKEGIGIQKIEGAEIAEGLSILDTRHFEGASLWIYFREEDRILTIRYNPKLKNTWTYNITEREEL
jgi:hypothetical protein